ncbi:hypothetical protein SLOPH_1849, partial [Spraguea lophii 42_110]
MKNIKGPRSALSAFIQEEGINIIALKRSSEESSFVSKKSTTKIVKRIKYKQPIELMNLKANSSLKDLAIKKILENLTQYNLTDENILEISSFLSRQRMMNSFYFYYLLNNPTSKIIIYDSSMILENEYVSSLISKCAHSDRNFNENKKNIKHFELNHCGQLTPDRLSDILKGMDNLEYLKISGGYLIYDFIIPKVKVLNLSYSKINDDFIKKINKMEKLDELNLSYCYNLSEKAELKISVKNLFVDETQISDNFFKNMKNINLLKKISLKNTPNINKDSYIIDQIKNMDLEYLDISGISDIEYFDIKNIKTLILRNCFNWNKLPSGEIEHLDISCLNLKYEELEKIKNLKSLISIDISWNKEVDNNLIHEIIKLPKIKSIKIFGCFKV